MRISPRYLLVEIGTAALFVAMIARFGVSAELPAYLYLAAVAMVLALIDIDVRRLPNTIVLPSYAVGMVLLSVAAAVHGDWWSMVRGLLAMSVLFGIYSILALAVRGGMGYGDVKLAGLLGLYLGWIGWGSVLVGAFTGFMLGALVGVTLITTRRVNRKASIPFGPAMLAGALLTILVANPTNYMLGS